MENDNSKETTIQSFKDLRVYQNLYKAMLLVHKEIVPKLPAEEKYDLCPQMRRASKSATALISEGFAKRYKDKHWKKYIEDTQGECNEMINHLSTCIDLYPDHVNVDTCNQVIELYDISCRQLTNLKKTWKNFHSNS
ncbi:MAG: four helix bundle protein [Bacteroidota bacterium]